MHIGATRKRSTREVTLADVSLGSPLFFVSAFQADAGGAYVVDQVSGRVGTLQGGATLGADPVTGRKVIHLPGAGSHVDFGTATLFPSGASSLIVAARVYCAGTGTRWLLGQYKDVTAERVWRVGLASDHSPNLTLRNTTSTLSIPMPEHRMAQQAWDNVAYGRAGTTSGKASYAAVRTVQAYYYNNVGTPSLNSIANTKLLLGATLNSSGVVVESFVGRVEWIGVWAVGAVSRPHLLTYATADRAKVVPSRARITPPTHEPREFYVSPSWWADDSNYASYAKLGVQYPVGKTYAKGQLVTYMSGGLPAGVYKCVRGGYVAANRYLLSDPYGEGSVLELYPATPTTRGDTPLFTQVSGRSEILPSPNLDSLATRVRAGDSVYLGAGSTGVLNARSTDEIYTHINPFAYGADYVKKFDGRPITVRGYDFGTSTVTEFKGAVSFSVGNFVLTDAHITGKLTVEIGAARLENVRTSGGSFIAEAANLTGYRTRVGYGAAPFQYAYATTPVYCRAGSVTMFNSMFLGPSHTLYGESAYFDLVSSGVQNGVVNGSENIPVMSLAPGAMTVRMTGCYSDKRFFSTYTSPTVDDRQKRLGRVDLVIASLQQELGMSSTGLEDICTSVESYHIASAASMHGSPFSYASRQHLWEGLPPRRHSVARADYYLEAYVYNATAGNRTVEVDYLTTDISSTGARGVLSAWVPNGTGGVVKANDPYVVATKASEETHVAETSKATGDWVAENIGQTWYAFTRSMSLGWCEVGMLKIRFYTYGIRNVRVNPVWRVT